MSEFSVLETNILLSKGLTEEDMQKLTEIGISSKTDFATVGDAETLANLAGVSEELAGKVMEWACGIKPAAQGSASQSQAPQGQVIVDSADAVYCIHCNTKQPKDYKSGDLCVACGKQAEPSNTCYWCNAVTPGKFCRNCGAEMVPVGELELALLLKREGVAKEQIAGKLHEMSADDKAALWERARKVST